jgi:hypothetical protein
MLTVLYQHRNLISNEPVRLPRLISQEFFRGIAVDFPSAAVHLNEIHRLRRHQKFNG